MQVVRRCTPMWQWGSFRGKRVLVSVSKLGAMALEDGRVLIRFREDDSRTYPANPRNVVLDVSSGLLGDAAATAPKPAPAAKKAITLEKPWIAYTDGACTGNPGPAGAGLVLLDADGKLVKESFRYLGNATNNIAELTAIAMVFDSIPEDAPVVIHTDSKYAIGVLSQGWKVRANGELVAAIKKRIKERAKLKYVPGHSGVPLNERADELAREAIQTRSSSK